MRILLTLDGSEFAEEAIPVAQRLAACPGAEVHVLAVVEPETEVRGRCANATEYHSRERDRRSRWENDADVGYTLSEHVETLVQHYLEGVARRFPRHIVRPALRVGPHPVAQILAYTTAHNIDLLVMATHGCSGISGAAHGSVAGRVLSAGVAPVVLVRPAKTGL